MWNYKEEFRHSRKKGKIAANRHDKISGLMVITVAKRGLSLVVTSWLLGR